MRPFPHFASWTAAAALLFAAAAVRAAELPDPERGRLLYENHCQVCHTGKVHARPHRAPPSREELRRIVDQWQKEEKLRWSESEIADVVRYLEVAKYRGRR